VFQFPYPPPPGDVPIGPDGRTAFLAVSCFLLVAMAYLFFDITSDLMDEDFWDELRDFHRHYQRDWWKRK
jgi:hypothetical protein